MTIDATDAGAALVPEKFKSLHFSSLPAGQVPADFAQRLKDFMTVRQ